VLVAQQPLKHVWDAAQQLPSQQLPAAQQVSPQQVCPGRQQVSRQGILHAHAPLTQLSLGPQAAQDWPQLLLSVSGSTQAPPQQIWPAAQQMSGHD
jgi:hypothetical protein